MIAARDYMMSTWFLWSFLIQSYCTLRDWFSSIAPPAFAECMYEMEICFWAHVNIAINLWVS